MRIPLAGRDPLITVARNLYEKNGVEFAIRGFALSEARQRLRMSILGEGDEGPRLRALAARLGVADRVEFHGSVARSKVLETFVRSALTIVPSIPVGDYVEATSLSMLEALALGVPVIASRVGGLEEVLDGYNAAFLVPARDPQAIARGIDAIAGHTLAVEDMVERGIRLVVRGILGSILVRPDPASLPSAWGVA